MGTYSFTMTGAEVDALLSTTGSVDTEVVLDKNAIREVKHALLNASFGEGYEQRAKDGINHKREQYKVAFRNRPASEADLIAAYFDSKTGVSFDLTVTNHVGDEVIKVVCDDYNLTYIHDNFRSMTANFRRVYE